MTEWTPLPGGDSETLWDGDTTAWDVSGDVGTTAWDVVAATTWTPITPAS
jgi:hypothetical protein